VGGKQKRRLNGFQNGVSGRLFIEFATARQQRDGMPINAPVQDVDESDAPDLSSRPPVGVWRDVQLTADMVVDARSALRGLSGRRGPAGITNSLVQDEVARVINRQFLVQFLHGDARYLVADDPHMEADLEWAGFASDRRTTHGARYPNANTVLAEAPAR